MFWEFVNFILGKLFFFCGSVVGDCFPKPLSKEEELLYLKKYKEEGDDGAREELIRRNLRLVAHVVKKYHGADDSDDLISTGTIGLIKAIDSYSLNKGTNLATYTAKCIENEILMLLRSNKKHGATVSLYEGIGSDKDGNELMLMDLLCDEDESVIDKVENKISMDKLVSQIKSVLTDREFLVVKLRYGLVGGRPLAQREVASVMKISRSYISRIEKKAIEKIRASVKIQEE